MLYVEFGTISHKNSERVSPLLSIRVAAPVDQAGLKETAVSQPDHGDMTGPSLYIYIISQGAPSACASPKLALARVAIDSESTHPVPRQAPEL